MITTEPHHLMRGDQRCHLRWHGGAHALDAGVGQGQVAGIAQQASGPLLTASATEGV